MQFSYDACQKISIFFWSDNDEHRQINKHGRISTRPTDPKKNSQYVDVFSPDIVNRYTNVVMENRSSP